MSELVPPHGGKLVSMFLDEDEFEYYFEEAETLPKIEVSSKEYSDIAMIGIGAFSPLEGFMGKEDYHSVLNDMHTKSGLMWPVPITIAVSRDDSRMIKEGQKVALGRPQDGEIIAMMTVEEKYLYDRRAEAISVFGTDDEKHPGVQRVYEQGEVYLGGPIRFFGEHEYVKRFPEFAEPAETRAMFAERGWTRIAAFQTRNPMHRSHEYLTKVALEVSDGLFLCPVIGRLKKGDIPTSTRMKCYHALLDNYYPKDRVVINVCPYEMRYAGPKEAILHAIIRQNYGCSHMIIGRDHAGVGNYYGPFDAQKIFDQLKPGELHLEPLKFDIAFWCYKCDSVTSSKTCPHPEEDHLSISGTKLREMLARGERPPEQFSRKEVVDILADYYSGQSSQSQS